MSQLHYSETVSLRGRQDTLASAVHVCFPVGEQSKQTSQGSAKLAEFEDLT